MTSGHIMEDLQARSNNTPRLDPSEGKKATRQGFTLEALHLQNQTRKGEVLLKDISLAIHPGELVILAGVDGSATEVLIRSLAGVHHVAEGEILVDGHKLKENIKGLRSRIGYVPSVDIAHQDLTVYEALEYAAWLRLPRGTSHAERKRRIESVLSELDLVEIRTSYLRNLSAGQKKCACIAIELIADPGLMLLENPLDGLDIPSANHVIRQLRGISNQGLPVVLTTHSGEFFDQADRVGFLTSEASLAWFGPPEEALEYFATYQEGTAQDHTRPGFIEVFKLLGQVEKGSPADWATRFQESPASKKYAAGSSKGKKPELALDERPLAKKQAEFNPEIFSRPVSSFTQWRLLSLRNLKLLLRDRKGLVLMLLAPLLIACIDFIFSSRTMYDMTLGDPSRISTSLAFLIFLAMTVGSAAWVREYLKEAAVYQRERQVALRIFPYVLSKVWIVALLAIYQGLIWVLVHFIAADLPFRFPLVLNYFTFLGLAILVGSLFGLLASFAMPSEKRAGILLVVLLIPQLIFSGAFLPLPKFIPAVRSVASLMPSHFVFQGLSTADGHGIVLASDACWQLPPDQRQALTDQQKQSMCSCMGINIFHLCSFPGVLGFYNQSLDQPEPIMPSSQEVFKFPDPPTPAPGETVEKYSQDVKNSFATALEANLATSGIYQGKLNQYMSDLSAWETSRKSAISKAEGQLEQEFVNFAPDYNANLLTLYLGLVGEVLFIVLLLLVFMKRKDFQKNEPY